MESNETILVTGASKGIGRIIAIEVARAGYNVCVHYNSDKAGALETLEQIKGMGSQGRLLSFDISNREECFTNLTADINENGAYYGVVLNAGITRDNAFPALEDSDWDKVIHTNLDGFYNVLKPIIMPMIHRRKPGRIITLSSLSGVMGNRGQVNYSASKAGLIGATKALAIELAKREITVNAIAPGLIETQMLDNVPLDEMKKLIPMQRIGKPEEVAATVVFLLSKGAGYITRQVINVNGGIA
ncbi:MAG: fabG [Chlamydiales bacterium]|jgi:3-oxoacyl-[acyl-carrier protein] reductase|nr:fabG [Chlamydiales bacterium]